MKKYHKIESLFERDMEGTKKLIQGKFRSPLVEYLKDNEWIFTEKIDGTNIRVHWDGHKVYFGGRTENAQIPTNLLYVLEDLFSKRESEELFEQKFGENEVIFFGEGFGKKIQKDGDKYSEEPDFALFDVLIGDIYLERSNVEELAKAFNCQVAPILLRGTIQEAIDYVKSDPASTIAQRPRHIEGVVGVPAQRIYSANGSRVIVKIKGEDYG